MVKTDFEQREIERVLSSDPKNLCTSKVVEYLGRKRSTDIWCEVSDELQQFLKEEYYKKPDFQEVIQEIKDLSTNKSCTHTKINRYYFFDLMTKVLIHHAKWSVEEALESKEVLGMLYAKVIYYPVFREEVIQSGTLARALGRVIQLGGKGIATIPSNFPLKEMLRILRKYNVNNHYYDYSCGWGVRLLGALVCGVNYYGTDPNHLLFERLNQFSNDYKKYAVKTLFNNNDSIVDIRCQGSEHFMPELENKIGLSFSSPPYFNLEDYRVGEGQSTKKNSDYKSWLDNYLEPTIENIYRYLIRGGMFLINIKNYKNYDLLEQSEKIALKIGFKQLESDTLKNIQRASTTHNNKQIILDNSEQILVFKKE